MRITDQDFRDIQSHIDLAKSHLGELGLTLHTDDDMNAFVDYLSRQEETHGIPTSHDPRRCHLHPGNSFWIYVRHRLSGEIVACHAQRLIITDDFVEECMAQTLFENLAPNLDVEPLGIDEADDSRFSGRIVFGGGLYIRPDWRGAGLLIFSRAARTIALRHFRADYFCGMQLNTKRRKALALTGFDFAHVKPFIKGGLPHKPQADDVQLSWSNRAEWLDAIRRELANQDAAPHMPGRIPAPTDPLTEVAAGRTPA